MVRFGADSTSEKLSGMINRNNQTDWVLVDLAGRQTIIDGYHPNNSFSGYNFGTSRAVVAPECEIGVTSLSRVWQPFKDNDPGDMTITYQPLLCGEAFLITPTYHSTSSQGLMSAHRPLRRPLPATTATPSSPLLWMTSSNPSAGWNGMIVSTSDHSG